MSMLPDIADTFTQYIKNFFNYVKSNVETMYPWLTPEEQEKQVFVQTDYYRLKFLMGMYGAYYYPNNVMEDWGKTIYCTGDFYFGDGTCTLSGFDYVGKGYNNGNYPLDEEVQSMMSCMLASPPRGEHSVGYEMRLLFGYGSQYSKVTGYKEGSYLDNAVAIKYGNLAQAGRDMYCDRINLFNIGINYTVNENEIISVTGATEIQITPCNAGSGNIYGLYAYPYIGNIKDKTNIYNFINNVTSTGQSVHNYTNTYTTPDGKTIEVYYGDNYTFTYVVDNEPVSYDDLKNAFNIAINQINIDNDSDIPPAPPFSPDPPTPPEPITDDDYTDMGLGVETDGMAMYNMAVVTRDELIQLITDFEANADTGLSFIPHVLGLYKLGFESSVLLTTKSEQIKLHKEPNGTSAFTSVENYNIVENQEVFIDCGSITVNREELLTNTFLDFSPYTTYEMFIPGCGWIILPDTIVGRTISVAIVFDLTTCSCKGVVRSEGSLPGGSGTTLATVNGIIGSSVPLSINETGLQRAAIMNGATQAAMALGTAFIGVGIGNPYMGASGVAMAASALASNHIAGNSTYTSTKGGATDYSVFGDGWKAVLKITRPVLEIPDNYGHSVGFVVNRYDTLSNFSGFTVCVNPHIHISATSDEKEEIKRLLEEGVILPEGE